MSNSKNVQLQRVLLYSLLSVLHLIEQHAWRRWRPTVLSKQIMAARGRGSCHNICNEETCHQILQERYLQYSVLNQLQSALCVAFTGHLLLRVNVHVTDHSAALCARSLITWQVSLAVYTSKMDARWHRNQCFSVMFMNTVFQDGGWSKFQSLVSWKLALELICHKTLSLSSDLVVIVVCSPYSSVAAGYKIIYRGNTCWFSVFIFLHI